MHGQTARRSIRVVVYLLALCAIALQSGPAPAQPQARPARRPNVLFMMCDQLTARALSCYGGPVRTPNIDRLAAEGVRFNQAVCPTPFCSPSRASIVTGMYPHAHGIVVNCSHLGGPEIQRGITDKDVTTERLLSEAGYETHHYGKWHLFGKQPGYYPDMFCPHPHYTETMAGVFERVRETDPAGWMDWYTWALPVDVSPALRQATASLGDRWKDARFAEFIVDQGRLKLPAEQVYDIRLGRMAVERIEALARGDRPFMLTCSFNAPHDPNVVPSPYYEACDPAAITLPANRHTREKRFENDWSRRIVADLDEASLREFLRIYYGMVLMIDEQVGRILKTLDQTGLTDDTIIVFTADHGDMMGGHGMVWKSTSAFYDEIATVPLLIRHPPRLQPQVSDLAADLTDLMPTLLELTGLPVPAQAQGQSLVPYLTGQRGPDEAREYAFSERVGRHPKGERDVLPGTRGEFMIRGQGYKYIRYSAGQEYLYDLKQDPGETRNLVNDAAHAARREQLSAEMDKWLQRTGWPG